MFLEGNIGVNTLWPYIWQWILNCDEQQKKKEEPDVIKINFCAPKDTTKKVKGHPTEWDKISANKKSDKGFVTRAYKELLELNKKKKNQFKKGQEDRQTAIQCWLTSLVIRELQTKITVRYYFTPSGMAIITKSGDNRCWQECGESRTLMHALWSPLPYGTGYCRNDRVNTISE